MVLVLALRFINPVIAPSRSISGQLAVVTALKTATLDGLREKVKTHVTATLIETLEVKNTLGEGVIWDAIGAAAWWTDIDG